MLHNVINCEFKALGTLYSSSYKTTLVLITYQGNEVKL